MKAKYEDLKASYLPQINKSFKTMSQSLKMSINNPDLTSIFNLPIYKTIIKL